MDVRTIIKEYLPKMIPEFEKVILRKPVLINNSFIFARAFFLIKRWNLVELLEKAWVQPKGAHFVTKEKFDPIPLYKEIGESKDYYIFPKYFIFEQKKEFVSDTENFIDFRGKDSVKPQHLSGFTLELDEKNRKQQSSYDAIMRDFKQYGSALLSLPPGLGKTAVSAKIAVDVEERVAFLVHKDDLAYQAEETFAELTTDKDLKTTYVHGKLSKKRLKEIQECDVVVFSVQSTYKGTAKYPAELMNSFGLLIIDECHHISADEFKKCLEVFNPKYVLALSGTPNRKDGLDAILSSYIGPISFATKRKYRTKVYTMCHTLSYKPPPELFKQTRYINKKEEKDYQGITIGSYMLPERLTEIMSILKQYVLFIKQYPDIQCLLFGEFRKPHRLYFDTFCETFPDVKASYIDGETQIPPAIKKGKKKVTQVTNPEYQFIFSTFKKLGEGTNLKRVKFIFFLQSVKDVDQNAPRALREVHSKYPPIIVDIKDNFEWFIYHFNKRNVYYKKEGFIKHFIDTKVEENNHKEEEDMSKKRKFYKTNTNHTQVFDLLTDIYNSDNTIPEKEEDDDDQTTTTTNTKKISFDRHIEEQQSSHKKKKFCPI